MELRDSLPTLSSSFLPDPSDDHLPTRNYGNDQALSYTDDNLLSNAAQVLGAMKGRKDSHISSGGTADIVEKVPRCDEIVTYTSSLDNSCFTTQAAVTPESIAHCNSLSSTLSTFPEERLQSSASRPSPRSEGTWSEEVEEAFQKAWRLCPLQGRKKIRSNGRFISKNQWISAYIKRKTGVYRTRKQVSSHIQTSMTHGTKDPPRRATVARTMALNHKTKTDDNASFPRQLVSPKNGDSTDDSLGDGSSTTGSPADTNTLLPQQNEVIGTTFQLPPIHRVKFGMFLLDEAGQRLHTFTSMQKEIESAPIELINIADKWMTYLPLNKESKQGQINSSIFLFQAYLNVKDDLPQENSFLAVELTIEFAERMAFDKWQCSTRIFEENGNEVDLSQDIYLSRPGDGRWEYLDCLEPPRTDIAKMAIPYKSRWWSSTLSKISSTRNGAEKSADPELINQEDEKILRYIEGIVVIQEIWAAPRDTDSPPQRMAIFLWEFKQTQRANTAATSWRRIYASIPLPQQIQPLPSQYQDLPSPHVALGAAVHPSSMPTFPDRLDLYAGTLFDDAISLPDSSQAPPGAEASSSSYSSAFDYVPIGAFTSQPVQGSLPGDYHSGAPLSAPPESWQLQNSFQPQDSSSSNSQEISSFISDRDLFSPPLEPWQPQAGYSSESQDMPWSIPDSLYGDHMSLPLESWQLQESFQPQGSNSGNSQEISWSASNLFDGDLFPLPPEPWQPQAGCSIESQDAPWSVSNSFYGGSMSLSVEPWQLQGSFQPQDSNFSNSQDISLFISNSDDIIFQSINLGDPSSTMRDQDLSQADPGTMVPLSGRKSPL